MKKKVGDYRALLLAGRWFGDLPEAFQDALVAMGSLREVRPNNVLFARGETSNGMFAVLEGQLRACGVNDDGKQALLTIVEPPSWVGEIPLFDGQPRTHDLIADTDGLVVHVPQDRLLAFLDREPRHWRDMALLLTAKLRLLFMSMEEAQLSPIADRVVLRLALIAAGYGQWTDGSTRRVGVSQETLAAMLAVSRQSVNQVLKSLEAAGLVKLEYGRVDIVDLEGLRRVLHKAK